MFQVDGELIEDIRQSLNKGIAVGSELFKKKIEILTGRHMTERKRGHPLGWRRTKD